jgi:hypothetical protein
MALSRFDILNAISTRRDRGYASSGESEVADELTTRELDVVQAELVSAEREKLIEFVGSDPEDSAPLYALTRAGDMWLAGTC